MNHFILSSGNENFIEAYPCEGGFEIDYREPNFDVNRRCIEVVPLHETIEVFQRFNRRESDYLKGLPEFVEEEIPEDINRGSKVGDWIGDVATGPGLSCIVIGFIMFFVPYTLFAFVMALVGDWKYLIILVMVPLGLSVFGKMKSKSEGSGARSQVISKTVSWEKQRLRLQIIAKPIIQEHCHTLFNKKSQTTIVDDYGNVDDVNWEKEKNYFFENVIYKNNSFRTCSNEISDPHFTAETVKKLIELVIRDYSSGISQAETEIDTTDPFEYELGCSLVLNNLGWQAQVTTKSGDQGVDIYAKKKPHRVVIQCKLYSNPVGNKAVQEAIAGKEYMRGTAAVVVTNSTFTPAARKLAAVSKVILLHHSKLNTLEILLNRI